ncbi:MAG: hypothetical protein ACK4NX_02295 [Candidatus Paceibacteria bacterium]
MKPERKIKPSLHHLTQDTLCFLALLKIYTKHAREQIKYYQMHPKEAQWPFEKLIAERKLQDAALHVKECDECRYGLVEYIKILKMFRGLQAQYHNSVAHRIKSKRRHAKHHAFH